MTLRTITDFYEQADSVASLDGEAHLYAGGTDVIPLARAGILDTPDLVDIKSTELADTIESDADEWTIGALTTLSRLEHHDELQRSEPAISEALSQAATPQIRRRATVGGNLLQRPRCSYYRDASIDCWMKGGEGCPAMTGRNEHLALSGEHCVATQPSDLATVLVALDAEVSTVTANDASQAERRSVADLLVAPSPDHRSLNSLGPGQVISAIHVSRRPDGATHHSTYLKAMDRAAWQFALVGVAAVLDVDHAGAVEHARLVASGVANTPLVLANADEFVGTTMTPESIRTLAADATSNLGSLSENRYKVSLLEGLVVRSLEALLQRVTPLG